MGGRGGRSAKPEEDSAELLKAEFAIEPTKGWFPVVLGGSWAVLRGRVVRLLPVWASPSRPATLLPVTSGIRNAYIVVIIPQM